MGIEYHAIDHRNKHLFELGKGSWTFLVGPVGDDIDAFTAKVRGMWVKYMGSLDSQDAIEYVDNVAKRLFHFAWRNNGIIELCNDCDDSSSVLIQNGYEEVDSRYSGWTRKDGIEFAESMRRHYDEYRERIKK